MFCMFSILAFIVLFTGSFCHGFILPTLGPGSPTTGVVAGVLADLPLSTGAAMSVQVSTLLLGPLTNYMVTNTYTLLPPLSSKTIMMADPSATNFPSEGVDILIGPDLTISLNEAFNKSCTDISSPACQQNITSLLENNNSLSLEARAIPALALLVGALVPLFAYAYARLEQSTHTSLVGVHLPYSDHVQISQWQDMSTVALATATGDMNVVTVTLTEGPLPTATGSPPTYTAQANGDIAVHLPDELVDAMNLILDQVICSRDLESQCTAIGSERLLSRLPLYSALWTLAQSLGDFPLPPLPDAINTLITDVVAFAQNLDLGLGDIQLWRTAAHLIFISGARMRSKAIGDYVVTALQQMNGKQCPPDESTPLCQNCGGDSSVPVCPGDPVNDFEFKNCPCIMKGPFSPYNPFGSDAAIEAILLDIHLLPPRIAAPAPAPAPIPAPAPAPAPSTIVPTITSSIQCFGPHGTDYLKDLNNQRHVTDLCMTGSDKLSSGAFQTPHCDGEWADWCNNFVKIWFTMLPDAPEICTNGAPEREIYCSEPLNKILEACPNNGGNVNNVCGQWTVQTCVLGQNCLYGNVG